MFYIAAVALTALLAYAFVVGKIKVIAVLAPESTDTPALPCQPFKA